MSIPIEYVRLVSLWGQTGQSGFFWGLVDTWRESTFVDSLMFFTPVGNGGVRNIPFYTVKLSCPASVYGSKKIYLKNGAGYDWPSMISGELVISKKIDGKDYRKKITYKDFQQAYNDLEVTNPGSGFAAAVEVHDFGNDPRDVWFRIDFVKDFVEKDAGPEISTVSNITDTTADIEWIPRSGLDSGICYSDTDSATLQDNAVHYGEDYDFGPDPFITTLTDLTPLTTYTVCAFLINKQSINYYASQKLGLKDQQINQEGIGPYFGSPITFTTTA
jgi:hypothetical protein